MAVDDGKSHIHCPQQLVVSPTLNMGNILQYCKSFDKDFSTMAVFIGTKKEYGITTVIHEY